MLEIRTSVDIRATPMQVWAVLTDGDSYAEWNPMIRSAVGEFRAGKRVTLRMGTPPERAFTIRPRVIRAVPGAELRLLGRLPGIFSGEHYFLLAQRGPVTRMVQGEVYRGAVVPILAARLRRARDGFEEHNRALSRRVEQLAGGPAHRDELSGGPAS